MIQHIEQHERNGDFNFRVNLMNLPNFFCFFNRDCQPMADRLCKIFGPFSQCSANLLDGFDKDAEHLAEDLLSES